MQIVAVEHGPHHEHIEYLVVIGPRDVVQKVEHLRAVQAHRLDGQGGLQLLLEYGLALLQRIDPLLAAGRVHALLDGPPHVLERLVDVAELGLYGIGLRGARLLLLVLDSHVGDALARLRVLEPVEHGLHEIGFDDVAAHLAPASPAAVVAVRSLRLARAARARHGLAALAAVELAREGEPGLAPVPARPRPVGQQPVDHILLPLRPEGRHSALDPVPGVIVHAGVLLAPHHLRERGLRDGSTALRPVACARPHAIRHDRAGQQHVFHHAQHAGLALVHGVAAVDDVPAVQRAPVGHAPLGVLLDAVADAFAVHVGFPLGQDLQKAEHKGAARALGDGLPRIQYLDAALPEHDAQHRHLVAVAHDARHLVDHDVVEQAASGIREHPLVALPVGVAAGLGGVLVHAHHLQSVLLAVLAGFVDLYLDRLAPLVVRGEPGVYGRPARFFRLPCYDSTVLPYRVGYLLSPRAGLQPACAGANWYNHLCMPRPVNRVARTTGA